MAIAEMLADLRNDYLDALALIRRRQLIGHALECDRIRPPPIAVAADDIGLASADRHPHARGIGFHPRLAQRIDERLLGLEKVDIRVPQRVIGVEDQSKPARWSVHGRKGG